MKNNLRKIAEELGFDAVGFAKVQSLDEQFLHFENWITQGFNANMNFLLKNKEQRKNPKLLFAKTNTVIVFAKKYSANIVFEQKIKIAKYALQTDYHRTIKNLLNQFSEELQKNYNAESVSFVDSGAILEKQWAVLAGIGWQGKNSLIINENLGSYFNIGIILTDLKIEPDFPTQNKCNNCQKCIDICPTSAIVSPCVINANKCISYHTIENKNEMFFCETIKSTEIKNAINKTGYIFGCDICQDICPFNQKIIAENSEIFLKNLITVEEEDLRKISEEKFNKLFQNSAIKRAKYQNFMGNLECVI